MAAFTLRQGKAIQIDDKDLALVSAYTWHIQKTPEGKQYVFTTIKNDSGKTKRLYLLRLLMNPPEVPTNGKASILKGCCEIAQVTSKGYFFLTPGTPLDR